MKDMEKKVVEEIKPGKYILAVSGGIDSAVLLDILSKLENLELIVAHFDHGIRTDSKLDQKLVQGLAINYRLDFETKSVALGPNANEQMAREARYEFLKSVLDKYQANGIITAHHQDDAIETAIINLLRGTGRRGLTALKTGPTIVRPLLGTTKQQIRQYAIEHRLIWREDSTNQDLRYKRNLIRSKLNENSDKSAIDKLLDEINNLKITNQAIEQEIEELISNISEGNKLNKTDFIGLPHKLAIEVMAHWLRRNGIQNYDSKLLNNLVVAGKAYQVNSLFSINKTAYLMTESKFLSIKTTDH